MTTRRYWRSGWSMSAAVSIILALVLASIFAGQVGAAASIDNPTGTGEYGELEFAQSNALRVYALPGEYINF